MKMKRRTLLRLIPAVIMGSSMELNADEVEGVKETEKPDCYIGLLNIKDGKRHGELHELEGNGYVRQSVKWKFVTYTGEAKLTNVKDITFPEAKATWGEVTHFALYVEPQGGVVLFRGVLDDPRFINAGDVPRFTASDLDITIG